MIDTSLPHRYVCGCVLCYYPLECFQRYAYARQSGLQLIQWRVQRLNNRILFFCSLPLLDLSHFLFNTRHKRHLASWRTPSLLSLVRLGWWFSHDLTASAVSPLYSQYVVYSYGYNINCSEIRSPRYIRVSRFAIESLIHFSDAVLA